MARAGRKQDKAKPTAEQLANGRYGKGFVMHVESATQTETYVSRNDIVEKWFAQGWPGFEQPARLAINWCHKCWEARGVIGSQTGNFEPVQGGQSNQYARDVELVDELDKVRQWFHPVHWQIFENTVRWGQPAGVAGSDLASNHPQAIASARAIVGLVANFIAAKRGYCTI